MTPPQSRMRQTWLAAALFPFLACGGPESVTEPGEQGSRGDAPAEGERTRDLESYGQDLDHAVQIAPGVFQARGTGNAHMIVTPAGRVIFDTGLMTQAERLRELLDEQSDAPVTHVILSHAHLDHAGGAGAWEDTSAELVAHRLLPDLQEILYLTAPRGVRRSKVFYPDSIPNLPARLLGAAVRRMYPTFEIDRLVDDEYSFEVGGVPFQVIHLPGAEGADGIGLWLAERKILFTGDFFGPLFPMFPNLYTVRGEPYRFPLPYIRSLEKVMALEPEMIVPSHFEPIEGKAKILADVTLMRDAVRYVHDATVEGMNEGKAMETVMHEVQLPPELELSQGHGLVPWVVRSIWEMYLGWFDFEDTTQLYATPASAVSADLVEMAGGADAVGRRAAARLAAGQPVAALHLARVALDADPKNEAALRARLAACELLLERSGGVNHHEVIWLESRIRLVKEALGEG